MRLSRDRPGDFVPILSERVTNQCSAQIGSEWFGGEDQLL